MGNAGQVMAERAFISIFKSTRRDEMYLYVRRGQAWDELPEALREQIGRPVHVMDLLLSPERKLARADAAKVLQQVRDQGFYLQLPPSPENELAQANAYLRSPEAGL